MPLKAAAISKLSQGKWAVRDVSFEANPGEVTAICGPTGSGKSVLLRILAGLEKPSKGQFVIDRSDFPSTPTTERGVCYVGPTEKYGLRETLAGLFSLNKSVSDNGAALIDHAKNSDAHVLLLDEVFCQLTQWQKDAEFESIRHVAREGQKCIVYTTSNFDEVLFFCDRVLVMNDGEVLQSGTPEEVYLEPATLSVAKLTGRNNIFEARRLSSSKAEVPEFQSIEGSHRLNVRKMERVRLGALNQNVKLAIRPEHISISFGASFPEDNLLKAVVTDVKFLGPGTLVSLDANGLRLEAFVMRLVGLNPGEECMIGMPPDRILVFAD